jgi:hypothetical protein
MKMNRLGVEIVSTSETRFYSTALNDRCGFVIVKEGSKRLLWLTLKGRLQFFTCSSLREILDILERPDIVGELTGEWEAEEGVGEPFNELWQTVLADVRNQCGNWDREAAALVPDRVKKQLLWAFNSSGSLDGDRFTTILKYEGVHLTPVQLAELASELTTRARPWSPQVSLN